MWSRYLLRFFHPIFKRQSISRNGRIFSSTQLTAASVGTCACAIGMTVVTKLQEPAKVEAESVNKSDQQQFNWRQERFLAFASIEFEGVPYLTPIDFLRCVTSPSLPATKRRNAISEAEYDAIVDSAPFRWRAGDTMFRKMGKKGLISYPEFLLLISIISKSDAGFKLAFQVFDRNSDGSLDCNEFQTLHKIVGGGNASNDLVSGKKTSLSVHFFGTLGNGTINIKEFTEFAENLQREVLQVEFSEASRSTGSISPSIFAEAVLRRTHLPESGKKFRLKLLDERQSETDAVNCKEFVQFFQFLRNIDDLFFALRMYDISGQSISQEDFQQAAKAVTGKYVPSHLLKIVFDLFDIDGDGCLSYAEFIKLFSDTDAALKSGRRREPALLGYRRCIGRYMALQQ